MRKTANSASKELSVVTTAVGYEIILTHPDRKTEESVSAFVRRLLEERIPELVEAHESLVPRGKYERFPAKNDAKPRKRKSRAQHPEYSTSDVDELTRLREQTDDREFSLSELRGLAMAGRD